jgi:hypothetical protein
MRGSEIESARAILDAALRRNERPEVVGPLVHEANRALARVCNLRLFVAQHEGGWLASAVDVRRAIGNVAMRRGDGRLFRVLAFDVGRGHVILADVLTGETTSLLVALVAREYEMQR